MCTSELKDLASGSSVPVQSDSTTMLMEFGSYSEAKIVPQSNKYSLYTAVTNQTEDEQFLAVAPREEMKGTQSRTSP